MKDILEGNADHNSAASADPVSATVPGSADTKPDPVMVVASITGLTAAFLLLRGLVDFGGPAQENFAFTIVISLHYSYMRFPPGGKRRNPNDSESDWYLYYVCAACAWIALLLLS